MTVLVVGGGISGLAAALEFGRAGVPTLLVEASDHFGGKVGTDRVGGFLVERGPDSVLTTRLGAITLAHEVGLGEELVGVREPRTVHILRDGRPVPMPDGLGLVLPTKVLPFVTTPLFSWPEKARMALDLALPRLLANEDESVGGFLRRRLGGALVDRLAGPLVGGIYGTAIDELSLDAVVPTLRVAERAHRSLLLAGLADGRRMRAARAKARAAEMEGVGGASGQAPARPLGIFASLAGGMGDLVSATVRAVKATGQVEMARGTGVVQLEPSGAGVRAKLSDGRKLSLDGAIVTTPGPVAATLVEPFAPDAARAVAEIPHSSSAVVTLAYRATAFRDPIISHGWLIPPSERRQASALTWSSNKWPGRAPDDAVLIRAFIPGEPAEGKTENELAALATGIVRDLTGVRGAPELVRVSAWSGTMPRYTVGHIGRVERAEMAMAAHPSVILAGAPYHGIGIPDCVSGARGAAGRMLARIGGDSVAIGKV